MRKLHCWLVGMLLLMSFGLFAQTSEITGRVTDLTGSPIPNATVRVKGVKGGTSADANGSFKIKAPGSATLIISAVGYEQTEIAIDHRLHYR